MAFTSQQDALRTALTQVLGETPRKGALVISEEQRQRVGDLMMGWLQQGLWSIRPGTRAHSNPLNYIVGKQPTCLIEAWVQPKQAKVQVGASGGDKFALIKQAVECGLISKEEGAKQFMALLEAK